MSAFRGNSWTRWQGRQTEQFPDPFCDMASLHMPETIQEGLYWADYLTMAMGPYREAINRVISYFLTDIEIVSLRNKPVSQEEKEKYLDFLNESLGIRDVLQRVALDYMVYGNSFTSLLVPFRRALACPRSGCGYEAPLKRICSNSEFEFKWQNFSFTARCPQCHYRGVWRHVDRRCVDEERLIVKRWVPQEMEIIHDRHTGERAYIWRIPEAYRQEIRTGLPQFVLERAPWEVIQAVKNNSHLMFDDKVIYHMADMPPAGVDTGGWGLSRVLINFRQAWYVQILQRFNEAIALDHVVPFRLITPVAKAGGGPDQVLDPILSLNMGDFVSRVQGMLANWRRDPAGWNMLPFPVEYQSLGGDANNLAPSELIKLGMDTLMASIGIPVELYNGTLSVQSAPAALRTFEATWSHLVYNLTRFLADLVTKVSQILSWEPVGARLKRVTHADDLNRQMAQMQLMMAGRISDTTGLASIGLKWEEENKRRLEEQQIAARMAQEAQEDLQAEALMDQMAQPNEESTTSSAGSGGGGQGAAGMAAQQFGAMQPLQPNVPITPEEMVTRASWMAQNIMGMPESQKDSTLIRLKQQDPTMHSLVRAQIDEMRQDAQTRGGDMVMQQEYGKAAQEQPQPAEPPSEPDPLVEVLTRVNRPLSALEFRS